jgi:pimeloyl-ACP methyl ester carboxylesterase
MPLLRINVCGTQIVDPDVLLGTLRRTLAGLPADSPIIFLTHGYKFSPSYAHRSPHRHILSLSRQTSDAKMVSWPRKLGVGAETGGPEPLCIALGWEARGTFWHAYRNARNAGRAMAGLIKLLRRLRPGRPVDVLAHSLGARVTLSALPLLAPGDIGRAILLAPAELQSRAMRCLNTPAGRRAEFLSVTSGENLIFDKLLEWSVGPHLFGDRAMATGQHCGSMMPRPWPACGSLGIQSLRLTAGSVIGASIGARDCFRCTVICFSVTYISTALPLHCLCQFLRTGRFGPRGFRAPWRF